MVGRGGRGAKVPRSQVAGMCVGIVTSAKRCLDLFADCGHICPTLDLRLD